MKAHIQQAQARIEEGFAAQQQQALARAEALYQSALTLVPEHPTALQLLGMLAQRRGDLAAAEALMRRSLRVFANQPHVWNNLGNLLDGSGRDDEALDCFERAVALAPNHPDAHFNRARLLQARGRVPEAARALLQAQALVPTATVGMLQLQAQLEADGGNPAAALSTLDHALTLAPESPALLHNKATLLQRGHRYAEALQAHERALALGLNDADAHYNRGNTLQSLGRHAEAVAAYRQALTLDPGHRLALFDVSRLRWRLGDADFDAELLASAQLDPRSATALEIQAQLLWRAGRDQDAAQAFQRALQRAPDKATLHDGLGRSLVRSGAAAAGLQAHARAVALAPDDADLRVNHAASLLLAAKPQAALAEAETACRLAPTHQHAWALLGLGWRVLGDARERWLNDAPRLVAVDDLPAPAGFADMATFCAQLADELACLHADKQAPVDQTLRHGTQTFGDLFEQRHPLVEALKLVLTAAVDRYIAQLPNDAGHPFLRRQTTAWHYTDSWSSRLHRGGFHTNHVHPHGWISSAFYVAVPPDVPGGAPHAGWLQIGQADIDVGLSDPVRLRIQPKPGRLVLFPSMAWHGTVPFESASPRLTIAFDVMPD